MALLFVDGFDHYATADITKKWSAMYSTGLSTISSTGGRRSGGAYVGGNGHGVSKTFTSGYSTLVAGMAVKPTIWPTGTANAILSFYEGSTAHITVTIDSSGKLSIRRGAYTGTILATSASTLTVGVWYFIEIKLTVNDVTGSTELRINGVADPNLTLTNVDTRNAGTTGLVDTFMIGQTPGGLGVQMSVDDLYVCDTSGTTNNNFLGDCRVDTLFPTSDGNYSQFTPSTGTSHFANVDDAAPNTTDYNSGFNVGDRDSYGFADLQAIPTQTIFGVQINAAVMKSDAGAKSLGTMSRLAGSDKDGVGAALGTSQTYIREIQEMSPAGAAWTEANINSAEFGVKVTA